MKQKKFTLYYKKKATRRYKNKTRRPKLNYMDCILKIEDPLNLKSYMY